MKQLLVLQYKIQFRYQPDKHYYKVKGLVNWCDNNKIGVKTRMINENKKTYLTFEFQVERDGEPLLRKWQQNIKDKLIKVFNRVPHEMVNLIENTGFEKLEEIVAKYEGAKS